MINPNNTHPIEEFSNFPWEDLRLSMLYMKNFNTINDVKPGRVCRYWIELSLDTPYITLGYTNRNETWFIPHSLSQLLIKQREFGSESKLKQIHCALGISERNSEHEQFNMD